jgi:hypothetical protein
VRAARASVHRLRGFSKRYAASIEDHPLKVRRSGDEGVLAEEAVTIAVAIIFVEAITAADAFVRTVLESTSVDSC